jgi:hypothetical protein
VLGKAAARALEAQELALEDVKGRVGVRRGAVEGQIEQRLGGDQEQAKAKLAEARERARALEQRHRESAEREQRRLQAAANGGFLAQVSAFARQTVDDAGNSVEDRLDALQDAVDTAFEAAQKAAVALIEAGRKWALDLVATFGQWVKEEVGTLVGKRFPEFAKEFDALVDQAVSKLHQGINLVAEGLKHDVNELVEGLREGCQQLLKSIHEKVGTLSTLARAVVEGDWRQAGLMLLDGALTLLGVDKAQFYKFVGKVQGTLEKIVSDPGAFLDHLEAAMAKGFGQFGDNFLDHLKGGVLEWLFGAVAEAGITLPPTFDLAGVFDITLQVLGLTKAALRKAAVNVIGEENVERVEYVWGYLEQATTQGLSGLWEEAKEFLGGLWDMVVGEAQNWAMVTLVQKAVLKLATMWNPAGALVQVVTTAWDLFQWTLENASRVKQLVDAVAGSMAEIADGVIGKAANWIEQALAKLVPMAVNLLANVLGLGGIGKELQKLIAKTEKFVAAAIEKLVRKVLGSFHGKSGAGTAAAASEQAGGDNNESSQDAQPSSNALEERKGFSKAATDALQKTEKPYGFEAAHHKHKLWLADKQDTADIFVASTPMTASAMLDLMEKDKHILEIVSNGSAARINDTRKLLTKAKVSGETLVEYVLLEKKRKHLSDKYKDVKTSTKKATYSHAKHNTAETARKLDKEKTKEKSHSAKYEAFKPRVDAARTRAKDDITTAAVHHAKPEGEEALNEATQKATALMDALVKNFAALLDAAESVERYKKLPMVGTYRKLTQAKAGIREGLPAYVPITAFHDYHPHHIPPRELMEWVALQAADLAQEARELGGLANKKFVKNTIFPFEAQATRFDLVANIAKKANSGTGADLTCILIHKETHTMKGNPDKVHGGDTTKVRVVEMMRNAKLDPILTNDGGGVTKFDARQDIAPAYNHERGKSAAQPATPGPQTAEPMIAGSHLPVVDRLQNTNVSSMSTSSAQHKHDLIQLVRELQDENLRATKMVFFQVFKQSMFALQHALSVSKQLDGPIPRQDEALKTIEADGANAARTTWRAKTNAFAFEHFM